MTGTAIKRIILGRIKESPVPIAPLDEQRTIVAEIEKQFSRLDEAVALLKRIKANLKRYKAAILKAAVEGKLTEAWRKQHPDVEPASKLLERILAERRAIWCRKGKHKEPLPLNTANLPTLPRGWAWATVDQVAAPEPNSITDGPFGSNLKTEHYKQTGPRVIRLQNIGDGVFVNEEAHISEEHFARLQKHRIFAGDLVIAALGEDPPRSCLIPQGVGKAIVKADCIRFKPHKDSVARYINCTLNSEPTRHRTKNIVHGVGRPRLNLGEIKSIVLPIPPTAEQQVIVAEVERRISVIDELEAAVDANLTRADRLRQAILASMFSTQRRNSV
jgi:type I restriction enzyme S subunit